MTRWLQAYFCCTIVVFFGTTGILESVGAETKAVPEKTGKETTFYVSTKGNDAWSGMLSEPNAQGTDGPLATLGKVRDSIRQIKAAGRFHGPVRVMLLEGIYRLESPLVLTGKDGGTESRPITYTAFPGHKPVLSGSRLVKNWKPYQGKIVQARLPKFQGRKPCFRQLFFNSQRQIRARWPNLDPDNPRLGKWAFIEATLPKSEKNPTTFQFTSEQTPQTWAKPRLAEVNVFPWYCWVNDIIPLKHVTAGQRILTLAGQPKSVWMPLMPGNRFCVENVLEELDMPGEWCLDGETGTLYFWPPGGNIQSAPATVPVTDTLIQLKGTPKEPVRHMTISGLTFTETLSPFPKHQHENFHSPTTRGAAVWVEHGHHCRVGDCVFHHLGGDGVRLQGPNVQNEIVGNEIAHVGGAGISLASNSPGNTHTWADPEVLRANSARYPKLVRNVISNNHIHHGGEIKKNGGAIHFYGINSVDNLVSHNLIHHVSDKGMTMQDGFGRTTVEYNEMYQLGLEIADTGGIMTNRWFVLEDDPDLARGNVIRFNYIHDVIGCGAYAEQRHPKGEGDALKAGGRIWSPYYTWGIYFDNSGTEITVFGNIVVGAVLGGVSMPVGSPKNNLVENNIFVENSGNQMDLRMGSGARGNRFLRNIIYYSRPGAMLLAAYPTAKQTIAECDYNLYYQAAGREPRVRGIGEGSFADWKKLGFDEHTVIADPRFVDPAGRDFRLQENSPAYQLGFRPIDIRKIGLQGKKNGGTHSARFTPHFRERN